MFRKKFTLLALCVSLMQATMAFSYDYCDDCCCERFWFDADYLYWKIKNAPEHVPLVVEGPAVDDGEPVLGRPGYSTVLGGKSIKNDWRSGGRFSLGYWFDDCKCLGGEVGYFILPTESKKHSVFSDGLAGSPFLTIPYFDVSTGKESSFGVAFPDSYSGTARLKEHNFMQGAEVNLLTSTSCDCCWSYGLLAGFRYWNFSEQLTFDVSSPNISPGPDTYKYQDKFKTQNNFYGGQIGARLDYNACNFVMNIKGKVALGAMCQKLDIHGHFLTDDFNSNHEVQKFNQGFFALPTNIGSHKKTRFSVIPEVNVNIGYQVTDCLMLKVGYTFIYATNVLWAGKQIDRNINSSQSLTIEGSDAHLIGEPSPKASLKSESLWIQGLNAGIEFKF